MGIKCSTFLKFSEIKGVEMYLNINVVSMQIPISRVITKGIEKVSVLPTE